METTNTIKKGTRLITGAILVATLLLSAGNLQAAPNGKTHKAVKEIIQREISSNIICPAYVTENNQVKALVRVNAQGKLDILYVETSDVRLKDYVISELKKLKPTKNGASDKFVVVIHFQVV